MQTASPRGLLRGRRAGRVSRDAGGHSSRVRPAQKRRAAPPHVAGLWRWRRAPSMESTRDSIAPYASLFTPVFSAERSSGGKSITASRPLGGHKRDWGGARGAVRSRGGSHTHVRSSLTCCAAATGRRRGGGCAAPLCRCATRASLCEARRARGAASKCSRALSLQAANGIWRLFFGITWCGFCRFLPSKVVS